jgi:CRISPR/Cas system CSM-associated protein Csm4 (group 5 of RAMP superfamily)|tara:strand:- start:27552 stop:27956 length:405 start_codon:yes stop_codon:yes gene_type:complete
MAKNDVYLKEFVLSNIQRNIVNLYKKYIILTEDIQRDHDLFINKLKNEGVSEDLLKKIDYFDEDKYNHIRKRILDVGNEINRDLEKYFESIKVELDEQKLSESCDKRIKRALQGSKSGSVKAADGGYKVKGKII